MILLGELSILFKQNQRLVQSKLISKLSERGFDDLRPSFIDILRAIAMNDGPSIADVGDSCGLKKQTMTAHLNELTRRGYIQKASEESDKRKSRLYLGPDGQFRQALNEAYKEVEEEYEASFGRPNLEKLNFLLQELQNKVN